MAQLRLAAQRIAAPGGTPGELVTWMGAVQGQDYHASLWAVGLRAGAAAPEVERAIAAAELVRTWPMRRTLHLVAGRDARWMLRLLAPRMLAQSAGRYRQLELDARVFARTRKLVVRALEGGRRLTRPALFRMLEDAGVATGASRGLHIVAHHAQEGLLCYGPREGKQPTLVLLDEFVPPSRTLGRDEALAELARRYFGSHGPATAHDFAWWTGLTLADVRAAVALAGDGLVREDFGGEPHWLAPDAPDAGAAPRVHLLPAYDEYTVAYRRRSAVMDPGHARWMASGNGIIYPTIVLDGQVVGTWTRTLRGTRVEVTPRPFGPLAARDRRAVAEAAERYGAFLGASVVHG